MNETPSSSPPASHSLAALPPNVWFVGQEGVGRQRASHYSPGSVRAHPGKMLPVLARRLLERYTRPGDWVLDPLSGIGTTGVEALRLGRRYVGIELEPRFVRLQRENLEQAAPDGAGSRYAVYQGDARRLGREASAGRDQSVSGESVTAESGTVEPGAVEPGAVEEGRIDVVLTSPPYADRLQSQRNPTRKLRELIRAGTFGRGVLPGVYGTGPENLGNRRGAAYREGMRQVYAGCRAVLKPGGLLIVVLQPQRERGILQPLHHETARLCQSLGFELLDEIVAVLGRVTVDPGGAVRLTNHASFWRRLALSHLRQAGWPVTLGQVEYVLVLRKPPQRAPGRLPRRLLPRGGNTRTRLTRNRKSGLSAALTRL